MKKILFFLAFVLAFGALRAQCVTPVKTYFLASSDWANDTVYVTICGPLVHVEAALNNTGTTPGQKYLVSASVPPGIRRQKPITGYASVYNVLTKETLASSAQINGGLLAYSGNVSPGGKLFINFTYYR